MVGLHPLYVLVMLFVLAVIAAAVVGVVLLVTRSAARAPGLAPHAQLSPDGKWWWDGRQWQPAQAPPQPPASP